jgi:spermidine/putrescine transport system permease protein
VTESVIGQQVAGEPVASVGLRRFLPDVPGLVLVLFVAIVYVFLYLPAFVIALYSFNDSAIMSWPLSGFSFEWYRDAFSNPDLTNGLKYSAIVALISVGLAILLGVPAGIGLDRFDFPGKAVFRSVLILPFLLPGVISGITLLTFFLDLNFELSLKTVIIGHTSMLLSVVVIQMAVGLARWDRSLEAAAMDLGASELKVFFFVILPNFRSTILGAALLGITISLDEVARTFFLTGHENTLPMVVLSELHRQVTPAINAIGTFILAVSLLAVLIWSLLQGGRIVGGVARGANR